MLRSSEEFYFNGHSSREFGIINVNIDSDSMLEEPLFANRNINEEKIKWKSKPYFNGIEEDCKKFELSFAFDDETTMDKRAIRNVMHWLGRKDRYSEMWFIEDCEINPNTMERDINKPLRIYKTILIGESYIHHFGLEEGYLSLVFKTDSPYCYSRLKGGDTYVLKADKPEDELNTDEEGANSFVFFFNHGDFPIKPEISLKNTIANQKIKIIGKKVTGIPEKTLKEFDRTYPIQETDFSKFPVFELSEGKKAKGSFELLDTVFDGETVTIGEKTYEFDLGDNLPKNKNDKKNILVPVESGKKATNTLVFQEGNLIDGSTVTIGDQCFEYDSDGIVTPTNVKVDISEYVANAKGILHLNSNLMPDQEINVGSDTTYTMIGGTNEFIIKMPDHLLTDGQDYNLTVRTDRKTLTQDKVNINAKTPKNISKCLVRNITKNPSDLGIRKMKYLDKDFVRVLWNGESDEDFQEELDGVGVNSRLVVNFDKPVDENTINEETITVKDIEGNYVPISFDVGKADDGKTVGITPKVNYEYDTDYILYVSKAVKTKEGKNFKQIKKIKFHTKKESESAKDEYFEDVSIVKNFVLRSGKQLDRTTVTNENIYVKDENGTLQDIDVFIVNDGYGIDIVPRTKYEYDTKYILTITTDVKDIENNSVVPVEKLIHFKTKENANELMIESNFDKIITDFSITGTITIPFDKKIDRMKLLDNSLIKMFDKDDNEVDILYEISHEDNRILKIFPMGKFKYDSTYILYVSNAIKYEDGNNLETPLKYKIITQTENEAKNTDNSNNNNDTENNKSTATRSYEIVSIDKVFTINQEIPLDENTVKADNIYVLDSKGNKEDIEVQLDSTKSVIKIYPKPVWKKDEIYTIYGTDKIKTINKQRVFVGDVPVDSNGNKGDYENAKEVFNSNKFEIIKTNGFTIKGGKVYNDHDEPIGFSKFDIVIGNNGGLSSADFNSDGSIKDNTAIISIPNSVFTGSAYRIRGKDRLDTKKQMKEYNKIAQNKPFANQSVYKEKQEILQFATRNNSEHISVELDTSIILSNNTLLINEKPKKIKNMRPNDDIELYEEGILDCVVDEDMLIPSSIPVGAKAYVGRSINASPSNPDDYLNAKMILEQDPNNKLGGNKYELIDVSQMTLEEKKKIQFKDGDLVIGGELAGSIPSDFDEFGNLKTTPPQKDNSSDIRKERVAGISKEISIAPAKRLCGSASDSGRLGTKKAMENWASLVEKARKNTGDLPEGYICNIALNGITVKYKVPKGAKVYGTGEDFYHSVLNLSSLGYEFINVGQMDLNQKINLPFKKGDIVVGGTGAKDVVLEDGKKVTVCGIPAIDIGEALRLGGANREETKKKIQDFASSLKVSSVEVGDIIKLKILLGDKNEFNSTDDENLSEDKKEIKENIRTEYHIIKNTKELSRNRLFIEFVEDIRTIHYIKSIEIEKVYKHFNSRKAEDYSFTAPYQIKLGYDKNETMINIIKAINDTGTQGREYSLRTFKNPIVLAQKLNDNEIELDAIKAGTKGNIPVSLVDLFDPNNRFLTPTLEGGRDCTQSNAIIALAKTIEEQNKLPGRYNKDKYTCTYDSNSITVTHMLYGEKYNNIICLANVNKQETTPYFIHEGNANLINLQDFLTRDKQMAKWDNSTLIGGQNPNVSNCILALKGKIIENQDDEITVDFAKNSDDTINKNKLEFEYKEIGKKGNIVLDFSCVNGKISGKKFTGGIDGLEENEEIYFNCEKGQVVSNLGKDRYKNFNNGWIYVPLDSLKWKIEEGECVVEFRYREVYLI